MSSSTASGRSLLCLPFVSTWMSRGHATRSWLVVIGCSVCFTWPVCIQFVLTVLVHHPEWDVSTDSSALFELGQVTRELQCGVRGGR